MAIAQNLIIDQNSTFSAQLTIFADSRYPLDLTLYTVHAQMKKSPTASTYTAFTCAIPNPTNGVVTLYLTDEQTALLTPGRYMYDVIVEDLAGEKFRAIEGIITVTAGITQY
jgi:hypothetical protein